MKRSFGSDNHSGIHERIAVAILRANTGDEVAYGEDRWTQSAIGKMKEIFGSDSEIFFVFNGTGANTVAIKSMTKSHNAVISASTAHINVDECGAPENFCGTKLKTIETPDGKLTPEMIDPLFHGRHDQHHAQPKVISITQSTELGTVYTQDEVKKLADFAHGKGLFLHMDGARLANAAAHLKKGLAEISTECGVDVLSFGGTKNGMMIGETVISVNEAVSEELLFFRKQGMQLASKMRFISAQFEEILRDELWRELAENSNKMAQLLKSQVKNIKGLEIVYPVQANAIFAKIPRKAIEKLNEKYFFYTWDEDNSVVRWMTHWATTEADVLEFAEDISCTLRRIQHK
ncbi:MAG TPA: low specificity L-threonine aldolase [bacterium]|nr:low specificity L-threonine aldolase [bacterium]